VCAAPPTAIVSGSTAVCRGDSATIQVTMSGTAPFAIQWWDGLAQSGLVAGVVSRVVRPTATTTYGISSFSDATCAGAAAGSATVTVDTASTCGSFYTVAPCRAVDTRTANGPYGGPALAAGEDRAFLLAGRCGIPATAKSVSVNLTVVAPPVAGFLTLHPSGLVAPPTSTLNYAAGAVRANNAVISLGDGGNLSVQCAQRSGTAQVIIDVNAYFQ